MKLLFVGLLVLHGFIHFLGFAKAYDLAKISQLTQDVSRPQGLIWMFAGLLLLASALLLVVGYSKWWLVGLIGLGLSQLMIVIAWQDAKFGTIANLLLIPGLVYGLASQGPWSFRAEYHNLVRQGLLHAVKQSEVTQDDLASLPKPLRCYLKQVGVVGRPRVHHFRARWRGRIRGGRDDPWMEFVAEQYNFVAEPARFFFMQARRSGLPVDVLHSFHDGAASMRVKLLSLFSLVKADGPDLTRAETVTLFNDLCLLAPAALLDSSISWEPVDEHSVQGTYRIGPNTVRAVLRFNERCELVDFVSDDRLMASADGKKLVPMRWSTPIGSYKKFGPYRIFSKGQGIWHQDEGAYAYFEADLLDLEINGKAQP